MTRELLYGNLAFALPGQSGGGLSSALPGRGGVHVTLLFGADAMRSFPPAELAAFHSGARMPEFVWFLHEPPPTEPAPAPRALRVSPRLDDFEREDVEALVEHMSALLRRAELRPYIPHKTPGAKGWPGGLRALAELRDYFERTGDPRWADRFLRGLGVLEAASDEELPADLRWPLDALGGSAAFKAELAAARAARGRGRAR